MHVDHGDTHAGDLHADEQVGIVGGLLCRGLSLLLNDCEHAHAVHQGDATPGRGLFLLLRAAQRHELCHRIEFHRLVDYERSELSRVQRSCTWIGATNQLGPGHGRSQADQKHMVQRVLRPRERRLASGEDAVRFAALDVHLPREEHVARLIVDPVRRRRRLGQVKRDLDPRLHELHGDLDAKERLPPPAFSGANALLTENHEVAGRIDGKATAPTL